MIKTEMGVLQMTTGEKLQKLRKSNNITQEQLSEILNVSRQSISKWEGDLAFPETDKLIVLAKIYNCSVDYLLNIENNQATPVNEKSDSVKKRPYNKKKLPFLIVSTFVAVLTFVFFAFTWGSVTIYSYDSSYMTVTTSLTYNFYQFIFDGAERMSIYYCIAIFLISIVITFLCIAYYFIDHKSLDVLIRVFYLIKITLIIAIKEWLVTSISIGYTYRVQLAIDIALVIFQTVTLLVNCDFKKLNLSEKTNKNVLICSTIGVCALFFILSGFSCVYLTGDVYNELTNNIRTMPVLFKNYYYVIFSFKSVFCILGFISFVICILLVLASVAYYFISKKYLKISILALNVVLPIIFFISMFYYRPSDLGMTNTKNIFLWFALVFMVANILFQLILFLKKKISDKQAIVK
ncbi:MAG: helix-turn-helix domain-containing protein [Bacilli bacterium]|nr:helix-turn-helix domain-containing protein [Bacilli bacterium]